MFKFNKKADEAVNEFNQAMKPVSLWDDAWKRLKKNNPQTNNCHFVLF